MQIHDALERHLLQLEADGRSGHTIGQYRRHVRQLALWAARAGDDPDAPRTLLLTTLILIGLGNVLVVGEGERRLVGWVALAVPLYLAVLYVGPTAYFFALTPLTAADWAVAAGVAAAALLACAAVGRRTAPP